MIRRAIALLVVGCALLTADPPAASAHSLSLSHVDIRANGPDANISVDIDVPLRDLALVAPIDGNRDDAITWGELLATRTLLEELVDRTVSVRTPGGACPMTPTGLAVREREGITHATLQWQGACAAGAGLSVSYTMFAEVLPEHAALVTLAQGEAVRVGVARARGDHRVDFKPEASPSGAATVMVFLREGVHHILIGYDHLAFLLSLLLPAALVRALGRWTPATSLSRPLMHSAAIVSAFTVAHSITLSLAALGWVRPAAQWVEAAIAASVLLAALNNVWPVVTRRLWLAGFAFGLVHGFGFAGALGELGLGGASSVTALLGFNLGVELGQLAVVCVVLPVLFRVRQRAAYSRVVMPVLSIAIALISLYWLFDRLGG
jgi:hypothetical protein